MRRGVGRMRRGVRIPRGIRRGIRREREWT
jgi:hypothetical protein